MAVDNKMSPILSQQLLLNVAEELKLPLEQIARRAEQGIMTGLPDLFAIQSSAEAALKLIDNYTLGVRLSLEQQPIDTESVSVSSVLYDVGQELRGLAKSYGVELELNIGGKFGPVLVNRQGLQAALASLGAALIEALPATATAATRSRWALP